MFVRIVTFTGARDIDGGLELVRNTVAPLMRQQNGWRGTTASGNRKTGVFSVLSQWETEADRDASESALNKVREEAKGIIGGDMTVDHYEQVVLDLAKPPQIGSALLIRPLRMDPAKVDENIEFFKSDVLPSIKAQSGYLALRNLIDRKTGDGVVGSIWENEAALEGAAKAAEERQPMGEKRGITFGEMDRREVMFADLP